MIALRFLPQGIFGKEAFMFSPEKYVCWQALQQGITLMPLENVQGGDMPGDTAHISAPVCRRVEKLLPHLVTKLEENMVRTFRTNLSSLSAEVQAPARPAVLPP